MNIERLLAISSEPKAGPPRTWPSTVPPELVTLLGERNGFYAFASALHVRALDDVPGRGDGLVTWNAPTRWIDRYEDPALAERWFFGEDVFGDQFCLHQGRVERMEAETGQFSEVASSLDAWAELVLDELEAETGYEAARDWQAQHGPLAEGFRLVPRKPFVIGGTSDVANLVAKDEVAGMRMRGRFAAQLRKLPDGKKVRIRPAR